MKRLSYQPSLIGIHGKMGAGKDYGYSVIVELMEDIAFVENFKHTDALKEDIEDYLGLLPGEIDWTKPYSYEKRRLLQWWGTDLRRNDDEDYWVNALYRNLDHDRAQWAVITDVRFQNEARAVLDEGGHLIRVEADIEVRSDRVGQVVVDHASEFGLDDWDQWTYVVDGNKVGAEIKQEWVNALTACGWIG